jgi:hypothetical protein
MSTATAAGRCLAERAVTSGRFARTKDIAERVFAAVCREVTTKLKV